MDKIPSLHDCNMFAARQAARFITQLYERHLAPADITSSQLTILAVVDARPGIAMAELAETVVMDRTSLVRAMQPLERDGLVLQKAEPGTRKRGVFLTRAGQKKYADAVPLWDAAQREYEALAGAARAQALREELLMATGWSIRHAQEGAGRRQ